MKATPEASASCGSQLDLAPAPLSEDDVLELDCGEDEYDTSDLLVSEDEDDVFITPARAAQPAASTASRDGEESSAPASPLPSTDLLVPSPTAQRRSFAQAASQVPQFKIPN